MVLYIVYDSMSDDISMLIDILVMKIKPIKWISNFAHHISGFVSV